MAGTIWMWIGFNALVVGLLALDLGVFHRNSHAVSVKEGAIWSVIWITLALLFNLGIYILSGPELALQFLTGYLIEKSLSMDNIFVFVLIFTYFNVPTIYQHRILFWGVLGALIMRGTLILVGSALLNTFHWIFYVFGGFLVLTGIRMAFHKIEKLEPGKNPVVRLVKRLVPVTEGYEGNRFFVRREHRLMVTPLLLTLVIVETTDLIFALDSIPAIFAITPNAFIVYTSNVFAMLGLRSLYFVFSGIMSTFHYLRIGLAVILIYVGVKMLIAEWVHISAWASLLFIAVVLTVSIIASLIRARRLERAEHQDNPAG